MNFGKFWQIHFLFQYNETGMANDKKTLWMWLDKQKERKSIQLIH